VPYLMIGTTKINEHEIPRATTILVLELSFEHGQHLFARCAQRFSVPGGWVGGVPRRRCWRHRRRGLSGLGCRHPCWAAARKRMDCSPEKGWYEAHV